MKLKKTVTASTKYGIVTMVLDNAFHIEKGNVYIFSKKTLQNFVDSICSEQRINCVFNTLPNLPVMDGLPQIIKDLIIKSKQPKMEEIV